MIEAGITFNDDLLMSSEDRDVARATYPLIYFALDNPGLRAAFAPIDAEAGRFKASSRSWGFGAVALVSLSLMIASASPLYEKHEYGELIAGVGAIFGVVGALIGFIGIFFSSTKQEWLERRMITERLRQLQFQMLIAWAPLIVAAAADPAKREKFERKRRGKLAEVTSAYIDNRSAMFPAVLEDKVGDLGWMVERSGDPATMEGRAANQLMEALRFLRLEHQLRYANSKLTDSHAHFWRSPVRQVAVFAGFGLVCVAALIALDLLTLLNVPFHGVVQLPLHMLLLCGAILALALRTIEDGMRSNSEVERYRHSVSALRQVASRFHRSPDAAGKLAAMAELEDVAYDEMVNFLKANKEARFVMYRGTPACAGRATE